jgi:heme/copper-type cytochrome/quinol oxidase subunit 1
MNQYKELQEHTHFLDTKKVIILSILFVATVGLIVFSILMLQVDFPKLGSQIIDSYTTHGNLVILLFFALAIYILFKYVMTIMPALIRLRKLGIQVSIRDKILFVLSFCFIQAITPGAFITEPYILF